MPSQRFFWAVALKNMVNHTIIADYLVITVCLSHHRQSDVMFKLLTLKKKSTFLKFLQAKTNTVESRKQLGRCIKFSIKFPRVILKFY